MRDQASELGFVVKKSVAMVRACDALIGQISLLFVSETDKVLAGNVGSRIGPKIASVRVGNK